MYGSTVVDDIVWNHIIIRNKALSHVASREPVVNFVDLLLRDANKIEVRHPLTTIEENTWGDSTKYHVTRIRLAYTNNDIKARPNPH
jgi:hypothetical protein